jgi:hypothetical protein
MLASVLGVPVYFFINKNTVCKMVLLVDYIFPLSFLQLKLKCHQIPHRPFGLLDFKSSFISFHCKIPNQLEITTYLEWVFNSAKGQATYRELPASKNPWLAWQFDGMSIFRVSISGNPIEFDLSQQSKFGLGINHINDISKPSFHHKDFLFGTRMIAYYDICQIFLSYRLIKQHSDF